MNPSNPDPPEAGPEDRQLEGVALAPVVAVAGTKVKEEVECPVAHQGRGRRGGATFFGGEVALHGGVGLGPPPPVPRNGAAAKRSGSRDLPPTRKWPSFW